ncbi:MAG: alternative ribosome rescue aminoacyl-tRNA hydrolase ArfB [Acidiferrobacter sp.]
MTVIQVTPEIAIDENEFTFSFVRASGPGGQNVNKVATAALLRFDVMRSPSLPTDLKARLLTLAGRRRSAAGEIIIQARRFRTQEGNRRDAMVRVVELIRSAAIPPKPRRRTRPTAGSNRRRLDAKRRRGDIKRLRTDEE